jgi:hypothetical protein
VMNDLNSQWWVMMFLLFTFADANTSACAYISDEHIYTHQHK